jgi:hypothetical protein
MCLDKPRSLISHIDIKNKKTGPEFCPVRDIGQAVPGKTPSNRISERKYVELLLKPKQCDGKRPQNWPGGERTVLNQAATASGAGC